MHSTIPPCFHVINYSKQVFYRQYSRREIPGETHPDINIVERRTIKAHSVLKFVSFNSWFIEKNTTVVCCDTKNFNL